jgi:hypothetical protein
VTLAPGSDGFQPGPVGKWTAASQDPEVVEAQAFDTAEVHLIAGKPGTTLVLLINHAIGQVFVWQVRVGTDEAGDEPGSLEPLRATCACELATRPLRCTVADLKCLEALRAALEHSRLTASELRLTYTVPGLQALLRDLQQRLAAAGFADIQVAFSGANLRVEGRVADEAAWQRLVVVLYRGMVGRMLLEDRVQIGPVSGPQ